MFERLKHKWGITSNYRLILILVAFSITGSLAVYVANPLLSYLGMSKESVPGYVFWPIRILTVFPIYQVLLIIVGSLLGQFNFFWNFEKKMLRRFPVIKNYID